MVSKEGATSAIQGGTKGKGKLEGLGRPGLEIRPNPIPSVVFLEDERARDISIVGGKGAGLAELKAIPGISEKVPDGFIVTASVYDLILQENPEVKSEIERLDQLSEHWLKARLTGQNKDAVSSEEEITIIGKSIKGKVENAELSSQAKGKIEEAYSKLCKKNGEENMAVAVRSSGVQEDGADKSFAGQNKTELNRVGKEDVRVSVVNCFASQFEERAIVYRNNERLRISEEAWGNEQGEPQEALSASKAFSHKESRIAVVVQRMIESSLSGVALSIDPITGASRINIELNNGIGEAVVGGEVTPDFFEVDRNNPENIVGRRLGAKAVRTVFHRDGGTESVKVSAGEEAKFAAGDEKVREIARDVVSIRDGLGKEVDTEFAVDEKGNLWWVQARPETVGSNRNPHVVEAKEYRIPKQIAETAEVILEGGIPGSPGVGAGTKLIADSVEEAMRIMNSEENEGKSWILVADMTTPDWVPAMKKLSGIITRHGGRTCHAAIVSRELGVPALVGTEEQIAALTEDDSITEITLDAKDRKVYKGILPLEEAGEDINVSELLKHPTRTIVGINIAFPEEAKKLHALAELGDRFKVSLLRIEFVLQEIGVHVNALIDFDKGVFRDSSDSEKQFLDRKIADKIAEAGYASGREYFVGKLSEGIASIAANFSDSKITLRTTDFKTNEYKGLIGGEDYESEENNPMIGWRGLVRSLHPANREAFKLELAAIKRARDMGYNNIEIMFPMVRDPLELAGTPEEMEREYGEGFRSAYDIMREAGLERGKDGLRTLIMVEDETNVERLDDYIAAGIDGVSIGSNDLTQLVLAVDRDNARLQKIPRYSEMNPAVMDKIIRVIEMCRERGIETGICGDGPSSKPDLVRVLTAVGIDSIGVAPDAFLATTRLIQEAEKSLKGQDVPAATGVIFSG